MSAEARPVTAQPWVFGALVFFATSTLFLLGVFALRAFNKSERDHLEAQKPRTVQPRGALGIGEQNTVDIFRRVSQSVVNVRIRTRDPEDRPGMIETGIGSGIIWNDLGYVVTNAHIVENAFSASVTLADGGVYEAEVITIARDSDTAVLYIQAPKEKLVPIPIGSSADLAVGQSVLAIGNPFGLDQTLTTGVISGLGRRIQSSEPGSGVIEGAIQTDAAINPGNSGGPLIDSAGRMIGLNTAIHGRSQNNVGVGFAVPVDRLNEIIPEEIQQGVEPWSDLGLYVAPDGVLERLGVQGVVVVEVREGGPAARAGFKSMEFAGGGPSSFDLIVAIDGTPVSTKEAAQALVFAERADRRMRIEYMRGSQRFSTEIVLGSGR